MKRGLSIRGTKFYEYDQFKEKQPSVSFTTCRLLELLLSTEWYTELSTPNSPRLRKYASFAKLVATLDGDLLAKQSNSEEDSEGISHRDRNLARGSDYLKCSVSGKEEQKI